MNNSLTTIQNTNKRRFRFSSLAFIMLCVYLLMNTLFYIEGMPESLPSLSLYAFVGLSALALLVVKKPRMTGYTVWFIIFFLICSISCVYSLNRSVSFTMVSTVLKVFIFAFMLFNIVDDKSRVEKVMLVNSLSTLILFAYLAYSGELLLEEERLGESLTDNANIFATVFMVGAFCSVYFIFFSNKKIYKVLFTAGFILQEFALSLSGSRKNFILPIVLLCAMILMSADRNGRKHTVLRLLFVAALLILFLWALFNIPVLYDSIGYRMEGLFSSVTGEGTVDASTQIRSILVDQALSYWKESPLVGNGIDVFKTLTGYGCYAHNNYAELLCDIGIFGTVVYYAVYVYLLRKLFKIKGISSEKWFWIIIIACLLLFDFGAITYNMYSVHMILVLALIRVPDISINSNRIRQTNRSF